MNIRNEQPNDYREVENLTREAFWNVYRPGCTEHFVLHKYKFIITPSPKRATCRIFLLRNLFPDS